MPYEESVGSYHFDLHGLDQSLIDAINEYPGTAEKYLRQTGNKLKNMAKKASPVGKGEYNGKKTKHLKDRWKGEVKGTSGANLSYELRSTAPHLSRRRHLASTRRTGTATSKARTSSSAQKRNGRPAKTSTSGLIRW